MTEITTYEKELIERRERAIAERETWPALYEAVRDAMALGFIPDAYGNTDDDTSILCPPTKFAYPRAGVSAPMHAGGIGAGAAVTVYTHRHGSPDEMRDERVWLISIQPVCTALLWDVQRERRSQPHTFDEALAFAIELGDYAHEHYIVPQYHPDRRLPSLLLKHWRELAEAPLPTPAGQAQLDLFAPAIERPDERAQRLLREALARVDDWPKYVDTSPDDRLELGLEPYDVMRLADIANTIRRERMESLETAR